IGHVLNGRHLRLLKRLVLALVDDARAALVIRLRAAALGHGPRAVAPLTVPGLQRRLRQRLVLIQPGLHERDPLLRISAAHDRHLPPQSGAVWQTRSTRTSATARSATPITSTRPPTRC